MRLPLDRIPCNCYNYTVSLDTNRVYYVQNRKLSYSITGMESAA